MTFILVLAGLVVLARFAAYLFGAYQRYQKQKERAIFMARLHRGGSRWDQASRYYRLKHPLCATCQAEGRTTLATCVDHIVPHKGDRTLMWNKDNWQSLCTHCHSAIKQANERNTHKTVDIDGYPTDPDHLCYKPRAKR